MKVLDICDALEELAPSGLAYDWDKVGLCIGSPNSNVSSVLVALTVTRKVLEAAIKAKAQLIVSHHPLIWESLKKLCADDPATRLCLNIAQAGISCYSTHTNLDVVAGGVNDILADKLEIINRQPLLQVPHAGYVKLVTFVPETHLAIIRKAVCDAGAGNIGRYSSCSFSTGGTGTFLPDEKSNPSIGKKLILNKEPESRFEVIVPAVIISRVLSALKSAHPYEEVAYDVVCLENKDDSIGLGVRGDLNKAISLDQLANNICTTFKLNHVRCVVNGKKKVRKVAILGGSGGGEISRIPDDIDVYISGDIGYHHALDAQERGIAIIDAGHAGLEKWCVPFLTRYLRKQFKDLKVTAFAEPETFKVVMNHGSS